MNIFLTRTLKQQQQQQNNTKNTSKKSISLCVPLTLKNGVCSSHSCLLIYENTNKNQKHTKNTKITYNNNNICSTYLFSLSLSLCLFVVPFTFVRSFVKHQYHAKIDDQIDKALASMTQGLINKLVSVLEGVVGKLSRYDEGSLIGSFLSFTVSSETFLSLQSLQIRKFYLFFL
jgi:hypothetical protein